MRPLNSHPHLEEFMTPTPRLPLALVVLGFLLSDVALAQVGICKTGADCSMRKLTTNNALYPAGVQQCLKIPGSTFTWGWYQNGATELDLGYGTNCGLSANVVAFSSSAITGAVPFTGTFLAGAGAIGTPSYSFASDSNTGFYLVGADQLGVQTAGTRSFNFSATPGYLEGATALARLKLDGSVGACLDYNSAASMCVANGSATLSPGANGMRVIGTAPISMAWAATPAINADSNDGRAYWARAAPSSVTPPVDLGGFPHPVLQRHVFGLDMGFESASTPTFYPATPRLGAGAATVTPSDAAAAATQAIGANPLTFDARTSVTTAAAGSISSMVTSAFIRRATQSPRWCQKVSMSTTANIRVWLGIASALPGSNDNPANSGQSFRYSTTAGDSKWQACYANGVGSTCVDTGVAPSSGTATFDTLCIDCLEGGTTACTWWVNGVARLRQTSGLGAGYPFFPYYSVEARTASAVTLYAGNSSVELY